MSSQHVASVETTTVGCGLEAVVIPRRYVSMGWLSQQGKPSHPAPHTAGVGVLQVLQTAQAAASIP